jgi:hypothetical protein
MQFEIKNRWTGKVQFTAEIDADESAGAIAFARIAFKEEPAASED